MKTMSLGCVRDDAGILTALLGGLTAACGYPEPEALQVCDRWTAFLKERFGRGRPSDRVPADEYRAMFVTFCRLALGAVEDAR